MHKGRKVFAVMMAILVMVLASCATEKPAPKPEPQPEVTTTTTVQAPVPEPVSATTTTTVATVTPTVIQPSVSEIELRNLFGQANALKMEASRYDIARVLPETYKATDLGFASVKADYDKIMDDVSFDGVKAYPVKGQLENSIAMWEYLLDKGMPLRVEEESDKAADMKFAALSAEAPELAADRFEGAEELYSDADSLAEGGEYSMAISAYQQTAAAYDVAAEKAKANKSRAKIFSSGYAKYADSNFQMGENKYKAEEELWTAGSLEDLKAGADSLREANGYYEFVIASGAEYKALEGKDRALGAQAKALSVKADVNAPGEYSSAEDILDEALVNQNNRNFESSYLWFGDATEAFDAAHKVAMALQSANEDALASAEAAVQASQQKSDDSGITNNVYLPEAKAFLENAKVQNGKMLFSDSTINANEAVNYAAMSDSYVDAQLKLKAEAEAKALMDAKAAADPAMADARTRMAWAENNDLKADYPAEYKEASAAMGGAELAYANQRYAPAKSLAEEVSSTLTDDFQAGVLADRKAAQEAAARLAAEKAAADSAMADARTRMAWAENNEIKADYPKEYKEAAAAMGGAEISYSNQRYVPATSLAEEVSTVLSDDFQKKVLAARAPKPEAVTQPAPATATQQDKAAEEQAAKAAAKAAARAKADAAMADAQSRMAWANENRISADYPGQYKNASAAMVDSFLSYGNEQYSTATVWAKEVSSILSDDFQAKVLADRQAAEEAARLAAEKAAVAPAMADARTRMAWAENNEIKADYPKEYKEAAAAMGGAEISYSNQRYTPAKSLAEEVSAILSDDFQKNVLAARAAKPEAPVQTTQTQPVVQQGPTAAELAAAKSNALADIDNAQARYDWAVSKNAGNNYPELLGKGGSELDSAKAALKADDFKGASDKARAALVTLSSIREFAPLPAQYVVRLIPERRDCLWRIAEYPFIYNNPLKWPVLYEANKKTFRDPSNPNLIYPNQVLVVPSIKGETRSGTWDPKKTYNPLPKK